RPDAWPAASVLRILLALALEGLAEGIRRLLALGRLLLFLWFLRLRLLGHGAPPVYKYAQRVSAQPRLAKPLCGASANLTSHRVNPYQPIRRTGRPRAIQFWHRVTLYQ